MSSRADPRALLAAVLLPAAATLAAAALPLPALAAAAPRAGWPQRRPHAGATARLARDHAARPGRHRRPPGADHRLRHRAVLLDKNADERDAAVLDVEADDAYIVFER